MTYGKTTAEGHGFDFEFSIDPVVVPTYGTFPFGDNRNFTDRRTFFGIYANDEWTPVRWFTLAFGGRYDFTSEELHVFQQEVGDPDFDTVDDQKTDNKPSWGVSGLFRIVDHADRRPSRRSASTAPRAATSSRPRRTSPRRRTPTS